MTLRVVPLHIEGQHLLIPPTLSARWRCPCPGEMLYVARPQEEASVLVRIGMAKAITNLVHEVRQSAERRAALRKMAGDLIGIDVGLPEADGMMALPKNPNVLWKVYADDQELPAMLSERGGVSTGALAAVKGRWHGRVLLEEGVGPSVALVRKVASYLQIMIWSDPQTGRWSWSLERMGRWHSEQKTQVSKVAQPTLREAIIVAFNRAQQAVAEACTIRDTGVRWELDEAYKATHQAPNRRDRITDKVDAEKAAEKARRAAERKSKAAAKEAEPRKRKPKLPTMRAAKEAVSTWLAANPGAELALVEVSPGGEVVLVDRAGVQTPRVTTFRDAEAGAKAMRSLKLIATTGGVFRPKPKRQPKAPAEPKPKRQPKAPAEPRASAQPKAPAEPRASAQPKPKRQPKAPASAPAPSDAQLMALFKAGLQEALAG